MLDPAVGILIIVCFATLFANASVHKLRNLSRFDAVFTAYALLPRAGRLKISPLVALVELGVAVGLIGGASRGYAAASGAVLLVGYAAAIAVNLWRGRRDLRCGLEAQTRSRRL